MRRAAFALVLLSGCALVALAQNLTVEGGPDGLQQAAPSQSLAQKSPAIAAATPDQPERAKPDSLLPSTPKLPVRPSGADTPGAPASSARPGDADKSTPERTKPDPVPARKIFGNLATPAALAPKAIGYYSRGCLAGGKALPVDGEVWQAMRLSRNRNWGHPKLIALIERLAEDGAAKDGWPGLLVGDLAQPRGGPMLTGHASHQVGLDADIWLTPMPYRRLSYKEREEMSAESMLGPDRIHVDPKVFTKYHAALIRRAASYPSVERIFVHPGIKKAMCDETGVDRTHFNKIRPYWGHHYHFHIRMACPAGSDNCRSQAPTSDGDGCGSELTDWLGRIKPKPRKEAKPSSKTPSKPRRQLSLDDLPDQCREVAAAGISGYVDLGDKSRQATSSDKSR